MKWYSCKCSEGAGIEQQSFKWWGSSLRSAKVIGVQKNSSTYVSNKALNAHKHMQSYSASYSESALGGFFLFFQPQRQQTIFCVKIVTSLHLFRMQSTHFKITPNTFSSVVILRIISRSQSRLSKTEAISRGGNAHSLVCFLFSVASETKLGWQCDHQGFCSQVKVPLLLQIEQAVALSFFPSCINTVLQSGRKIWLRR